MTRVTQSSQRLSISESWLGLAQPWSSQRNHISIYNFNNDFDSYENYCYSVDTCNISDISGCTLVKHLVSKILAKIQGTEMWAYLENLGTR